MRLCNFRILIVTGSVEILTQPQSVSSIIHYRCSRFTGGDLTFRLQIALLTAKLTKSLIKKREKALSAGKIEKYEWKQNL